MLYHWKVRLLKRPRLNLLWRHLRARRGDAVGNYTDLPALVRQYAPGKSFADVGCMWGVNGEHAFVAEAAGARTVKAVDVFGPTPEFEAKRRERKSSVEFVLGDAHSAHTLSRVGEVDVVLCSGVLNHHPSPFNLLSALRRLCKERLILRCASIPEVSGLPNAAIYYPMLSAQARELWNLSSLGLQRQLAISEDFAPAEGYGNWFWGFTPSCLESLLSTAGFQIERRMAEPFAHTLICRAVEPAFAHPLPSEAEALEMARAISSAGVARPG